MNSMAMTTQELQLCEFLKELPRRHKNRYNETASRELLSNLFWSLAGGQDEHMRLFFPDGRRPAPNEAWSLSGAQGAVDGSEYTEAARGKPCGHIFRSGETTFRCKTCSSDDTCVLCSRCYNASLHVDHQVYVTISPGNSGCCDCGDAEAWRVPLHCTIHSADEHDLKKAGKMAQPAGLPEDLVESIRMTIGRAIDYMCDVISCSPEQLRRPKTEENIKEDELMSRLTSSYYRGDLIEEPTEYALVLWNDEKHTVNEVRDQVSRACKIPNLEGLRKAHETDEIGRSIIRYDTDIANLLEVSRKIEHIKVTVTIRSARDTFREQMCGTIVEWLGDIAGCSVGNDHDILRYTVCEEMLKPWRTGSKASNAGVGKEGLYDHEKDDATAESRLFITRQTEFLRLAVAVQRAEAEIDEDDDLPEDAEADDGGDSDNDEAMIARIDDAMLVEIEIEPDGDVDMIEAGGELQPSGDIIGTPDTALETREATFAGYPPPPPPPPPPALQQPIRDRDITPSDNDELDPLIPPHVYNKANLEIPRTPAITVAPVPQTRPPRYWLETPAGFSDRETLPLSEDLWQRVRLDWMILFDLRLWKKVRIDLRDLYISTVVSVPQFKRILGLRFAGLYTTLAQLYLIADREPDHSIINLSVQMLTTPSITYEIVERGNFLTALLAILYTFLTRRQVGHPHEVYPDAELAFEAGSVTNRRMYHFFMDLRYLFRSENIQEKLRQEERYLLQFLDLVKLHQGICPNVRAVGEHVEYETDAWISASLITREINRLCRMLPEAYHYSAGDDITYVAKAIRLAAKTVIINSLGAERKRFSHAEINDEIKFKKLGDFEFDTTEHGEHLVVKFVVDEQPISFHHALHYTLSWLIESGKSMSREQLVGFLTFSAQDFSQKPRAMGQRRLPAQEYQPEDYLMAAFDYPLRVCVWLAQMRAGMWVRNGMSLRHQHQNYRGVVQRDVSHHRDIFLLQTAMVVCDPSRVLASIIDRYGMEMWLKGIYEQKSNVLEDTQQLDLAEDLIHLLIILLCDRVSLLATEDEPNPNVVAMRRDIVHVLYFKPMSFSEISGKISDKYQEQDEFPDVLDEMTRFKAPDGLSDVGTFELRDQFYDEVDPYIAHYNKNQREEAENIYKTRMSKKTGRPVEDIVYEPKLRQINSGVFKDISRFTRTGMFAQIIYYALLYPLKAKSFTPNVATTRVENFLQVVLHLILVAIAEDKTEEDDMSEESLQSFVYNALTRTARSNFSPDSPSSKTIVSLLEMMSSKEDFKVCHPKISLVLKRMKQKRPSSFEMAFNRLGVPVDRISTASPGDLDATLQADKERKKKMALERQAKVMAQFQAQQKTFIDTQGEFDWGDEDLSDDEMQTELEEHKKYWKYPSGNCILCQEDCNDTRPYGTFAFIGQSSLLRQTDFSDIDFLREAANTPSNLDHSSEGLRPFGVAGENKIEVRKITADGNETITESQNISKGFPPSSSRRGPVSVGCGHIMHYKCFEQYIEATKRRHSHQIARHHPENLNLNEFVCPLCKALGNAFLPIIWRSREETYPGVLSAETTFDYWLDNQIGIQIMRTGKRSSHPSAETSLYQKYFSQYASNSVTQSLESKISQLDKLAWSVSPTFDARIPSAPGAYPPEPAEASTGGSGNESVLTKEIIDVYRRLKDTMKKNKLPSRYDFDREQRFSEDLCDSDVLARTLGYSIAGIEINQRGVQSDTGSIFIDRISEQSLTHLRILAETAMSYVVVGGLKYQGENRTAAEFSKDHDREMFQLFIGHPHIFENDTPSMDMQRYKPLLEQDCFVFLAECSLCLVPVSGLPIHHVMQLCYIAEIVKVFLALSQNLPPEMLKDWVTADADADAYLFTNFCRTLDQFSPLLRNSQKQKSTLDKPLFTSLGSSREFVKKYALVFLRKCAILLHIRYGTDFSSFISSNADAEELDRLTEALHLPSFGDICAMIGNLDNHNPTNLQRMVYGWIRHAAGWSNPKMTASTPEIVLRVAHPAIFELIGLPKNYTTLIDEVSKRRCPSTGKELSDPMLCLFCGELFCGQANCCLRDEHGERGRPVRKIGGAQQHRKKCQGDIGLYINIRKCTVFYQHCYSGSWMTAPYMDKYGEVDPGLRHGRQLFLNQKRYDALLRTVWLQHGVPSVISRKLEADINNGGWETI